VTVFAIFDFGRFATFASAATYMTKSILDA